MKRETPPDAPRWLLGAGLFMLVLGLGLRSPGAAALGAGLAAAGATLWRTARSLQSGRRHADTVVAAPPYRQPARVDYVDGRPAWPVRVVHPGRFKGVDYDVQFALFRMPDAALIACLLRLYDIPESPYFLHRVFDAAHLPVREYLAALAEEGEWMLSLESRGSEDGLARRLSIDGEKLARLLAEAEDWNRRLGRTDGARALKKFLEVFEPEAEKGGCEAGWRAVEKRFED